MLKKHHHIIISSFIIEVVIHNFYKIYIIQKGFSVIRKLKLNDFGRYSWYSCSP